MDDEKKISPVETILLTMYIGLTDVIGIILVIFALDDFWIIDALTFPVTQFYFRIKRVKGTADLVFNVLELIPYVGALPLRTVGLLITIYIANHPKSAIGQVAQATGGKIPKI